MKFLTTGLESVSCVRHGFFTRQGGVSAGLYASLNCGFREGDKTENVVENRSRAASALGLAGENLVVARQVHGTDVAVVKKPWKRADAPEADALATAVPGVGLGVLTADCAPVLFADEKNKVIAAAHAGWRGALAGVLEATVETMRGLGSNPKDIAVAIGPCIAFNSYEVKDDFAGPFMKQDKGNKKFFKPASRKGHLLFDLPGYCAARLSASGIKTVHDVRQDTLTSGNIFFSNRRAFLKSEKGFGVQISIIALK